jgi:hypothetical protein
VAESAASAPRSAERSSTAVECPPNVRPALLRYDGERNADQAFPVALEQALLEFCPLLIRAAQRQDDPEEEHDVSGLDPTPDLGLFGRVIGWDSDRSGEVVIVSHQIPLSGRSSGCRRQRGHFLVYARCPVLVAPEAMRLLLAALVDVAALGEYERASPKFHGLVHPRGGLPNPALLADHFDGLSRLREQMNSVAHPGSPNFRRALARA